MSNIHLNFPGPRWTATLAALLLTGSLLAACAGLTTVTPSVTPAAGSNTATGSNTTAGGASQPKGPSFSLNVALSEGQAAPGLAATPIPPVNGDPLSQNDIDAILARLPALPTAEQSAFNRPSDSLPPPKPGVTVPQTFPPTGLAPTPVAADNGPLLVLRHAPEGEIPVAPFLSVTFNQAMVPLGTLEDLSAKDVPVQLQPALPGKWRWLGTRTLTFEYDSTQIDRLPKATQYTVTVPAGTKSAAGGALAQAVSWTFTTPPAKVLTFYPYDSSSQPLNPLMFALFDQRIDPASVLANTHATAGGQPVNLQIASADEIAKDATISALTKDAPDGRWLAFRASAPFPADTAISVIFGPGLPSAEGPLLSKDAQTYNFQTYAPLKIVSQDCNSYQQDCPPLASFSIRFNNPLDSDSWNENLVKVDPAIPGQTVNLSGDTIIIDGQTKGRTTYTVTISGALRDSYGQTLGSDARLTFKVGAAEPLLLGPQENFISLDPASTKPVVSVYATNYSSLDVKIYAMQPSDWPAFKQYTRDWRQENSKAVMPGKLLSDEHMKLSLPADTLTQVDIDLSKYLKDGSGQFALIVSPPKPFIELQDAYYQRLSRTTVTWVQVTKIGLDAYTDHSSMLVWATDLRNGAPLNGVSLRFDNGTSASSSADGTVRLALPQNATYLVGTLGSDTALLPRSNTAWDDEPWTGSKPSDELRWFVFDDRAMYRPGETIHLKGWVRRLGGLQTGDISLEGANLNGMNYTITDPQGNSIGSGSAQVDALGGFDLAFDIPKNVNLGQAQIQLTAQGSLTDVQGAQYYHTFQVQQFRTPEFEVTARNESAGPYFAGDAATLAVQASYYAGGGLPNADVTWTVSTTPTNYDPPNWPDYTFGEWTPWWGPMAVMDEAGPYFGGPRKPGKVDTYTGKTDASGTHYLHLDFSAQGDPSNQPRPQSVSASATVMDVNRQAWAGSTSLLVHPSSLYIGLHSDRYFVELNAPLKIDYIVTDIDGKAVSGQPVTITASRLEWKVIKGDWTQQEVDPQTCSPTSQNQPDSCTFQTAVGGEYRITATVKDAKGRLNETRLTRWVAGGKVPPSRKVQQETVQIIPDKQTYQPGETAHLLVISPFSPAEGLLTVSRSGVLYTKRFTLQGSSTSLDIPIESAHIPNLEVQVDLNGSAARVADDGVTPLPDIPARPAYASGSISLSIPPVERTLNVQVAPEAAKTQPGAQTSINVVVKDASGQPVQGAEVSVVAVDEAILALTDYKLDNPLDAFYSNRPSYLGAVYSRASLVLADPLALAHQSQQANADQMKAGTAMPAATASPLLEALPAAAPAARGGGPQASPAPAITVRTDFNPLAVFAPAVTTGPDGSAKVSFKLPDNLTRYRVMVVAVDPSGKKFGSGESNITARLPLMVRPSAPRFLNFGDKFELPVVLQNQTDQPLEVMVAARASNLKIETAGLRVIVPPEDRVEVRFPASTDLAGSAHIQIAAVSGDYSDAANLVIPVYTPATSEAFATYGVIDNGAVAQPVQYPSGVFPQYGGLEISTSSTSLQALTDAVLYLDKYPYECSEQISSRVLAIASLRDVLSAFHADGLPSPAVLQNTVDSDLAKLAGMQNADGGFPVWQQGDPSEPFYTVHVALALQSAEAKGFNVPSDMKQRALTYLQQIESHYPSWYNQDTRNTISAYALFVRNRMGDRDAAKALSLVKQTGLDGLSLDALGWVWPVLDDKTELADLRTYVANKVVETPGAANFTTSVSDQDYVLLRSDRRTDAILLDDLISDNPQSDLIPKVVAGLLAHRRQGHWDNTQEDVFVLLALDKYFNTYEKTTPDFVAQVWLGDTYAASSDFHGRSTATDQTLIPMGDVLNLTAGGTQNLVINKDGAGRLYYRLGLKYAPTSLTLAPLDMGFVVQRTYEAVDNPSDVTRGPNGEWIIKAGARVRVRIAMTADNRRYNVALVDPLPAGLEIMNPDLAVTGAIPQDPASPDFTYGWWWWRATWYDHQNLRDDRAEAFTSLLWDGSYNYSYVARATTPGTFIVPPSKAEEMYSPEVFGRGGTDVVIVK